MDNKIIWIGESHLSLEKCQVIEKEQSFHCRGEIVGNKNNQIYGVDYQLVADDKWKIRFFSIECKQGHKNYSLHAHKINELWVIDECEHPELNDCFDIDISVTPFTNTLPINRLKLEVGEQKEISVLYINPLEERFTPLIQQYERVSEDTYLYRNLGTEFESEIIVDKNGFVLEYPKLYQRIK